MNTPLMKITGNFTMDESIITLLGMLVGAAENISPSEEKQKDARIMARTRIRGYEMVMPKARPMSSGITEMRAPKMKEASISPRMIVETVTGQDINLSSVLACVSQGATAGDMAVAVKKRIIPKSPGMVKLRVSCLPIIKARKRKTGKIMPNITTGPLE